MEDLFNPFALVRASDYTDEEINSLWVDIGSAAVSSIIEPRSKISKYILGGKGTGKTHLLRYFSYPVARLRSPSENGLTILSKLKFLAIFLRATGLDSDRFELIPDSSIKWQHLFGVYLELRLVEGVLEALFDIKTTSDQSKFNDSAFIAEIAKHIDDPSLAQCKTLKDFNDWVVEQRRNIDREINNAAFSGSVNLRIPFSLGRLCLPIGAAIAKWNESLQGLPLIYMIDEIENFTASQQEVVNSFIRYGEGLATFRVTGRLYARKTFSTLGNGEENREGAEFKTTFLDDILRSYPKYPEFAEKFVIKRLQSIDLTADNRRFNIREFDPHARFEEVSSDNFYNDAIAKLGIERSGSQFTEAFANTLSANVGKELLPVNEARKLALMLTGNLPVILQKLNLLLFCKKFKKNSSYMALAQKIYTDSKFYFESSGSIKGYYATAYNHYAADLFAQLCRESTKESGVPYAGFDNFVKMSSGNPRNLLVVLGRAYAKAAFKAIDFINGPKLSIALQTEAALEAARFTFEADTNFGTQSDLARDAVARLGSLLRTARFSLNIPEVSPLAISFAEDDLTLDAKKVLQSALNYSLVFEIAAGRPDRNSQRLNKKIQMNPILSPRWGLPIARRGDLGLSRELVNAIFDPNQQQVFDLLLNSSGSKWNNPFKQISVETRQTELF